MKKFIRIEKVKKFLEKKELAKTKTLKRKHQRKNKKLGLLIQAFFCDLKRTKREQEQNVNTCSQKNKTRTPKIKNVTDKDRRTDRRNRDRQTDGRTDCNIYTTHIIKIKLK